MQLSHKQKIPSEPRTTAIPNSATRDKRNAKFMRSMIRIRRQPPSILNSAHGLPPSVNHAFGIHQMLALGANRDNTCDHVFTSSEVDPVCETAGAAS